MLTLAISCWVCGRTLLWKMWDQIIVNNKIIHSVVPKDVNYCHLPLGGTTVRHRVIKNELFARGQKL